MKQLLLLCTLVVGLITVQAQNPLSLSWEGEPIGDTIVAFGSQNDFDIIAHAIVTNDSDHEMNIKVRRQRLEMQEGSLSQFCWGICYAPPTEVSSQYLLLLPGESCPDEHFSGHYLPQGAWGSSYVEYTFFNMDNEEENVKVVAKFSATITGNKELLEDIISIYPNPASSHVTIESPESIRKVSIFDLTGKMVYNSVVQQQKAAFNIEFLEKGIYLVQLQTAKGVRTEKLYVQ